MSRPGPRNTKVLPVEEREAEGRFRYRGHSSGATTSSLSPASPQAKLSVGWLSNPAPSVMVSVKNPQDREVLAFKLPGDWETDPASGRLSGGLAPAYLHGPQDFIPWSRRPEALGAPERRPEGRMFGKVGFL